MSEAFAVLSPNLQFKGMFFWFFFSFSSSEHFNVRFSLKSSAAAAWVEQYILGSTYFLLKQAVEGEDKHALERVEDGEEVRQDNGRLADEEQAK